MVERDSLILACVSERVSADALLARYDATDQGDTRHRVNALRTTLGDLHETDGAFAVVLYDAAAGRVLAARTANSLPLAYGFTADGVLVACAGLTAERLMPGAGMDLTPLPSGRFVFGHRYVKPIEFTKFWGTASANRSAAPARKARRSVDGGVPRAPARRVSTVVEEADLEAAAANGDETETKTASRWGRTGSVGDDARLWTSSAKILVTETPREGAYVPPARRAALAKAEEEAKEMKKKAEEMKKKAEEMKKKAEEMKKFGGGGGDEEGGGVRGCFSAHGGAQVRGGRAGGARARGGGDGGVFAGTRVESGGVRGGAKAAVHRRADASDAASHRVEPSVDDAGRVELELGARRAEEIDGDAPPREDEPRLRSTPVARFPRQLRTRRRAETHGRVSDDKERGGNWEGGGEPTGRFRGATEDHSEPSEDSEPSARAVRIPRVYQQLDASIFFARLKKTTSPHSDDSRASFASARHLPLAPRCARTFSSGNSAASTRKSSVYSRSCCRKSSLAGGPGTSGTLARSSANTSPT